ncbi:AAA family ATPase [Mycobacterium sp. 1274761.0]|uniref:ATP-binding protein n=1 Tax=Mycobacterium sp. 1274761.0 TaxID=1834077 RepID=UPI001E64A2FB|nr:LuxR family transcriptional regulator [Mycobacterium sp. 1274761.0]
MPSRIVTRPEEGRAVAAFLTAAASEPSGLVAEGEPGIGKTTLCLSTIESAESRGFRVLAARPAEPESVLAYASLADLLSGVDATVLAGLPTPQQLAIDRVLLRAEAEDLSTDQRAVGAGFLSVIELLAEQAPVLLAIDDLQWLDPSSRNVIAFAARRLSTRVGVFGTARTDPEDGRAPAPWLQLPEPDGVRRIQLRPLSLGGLNAAITQRLGHSLSRPAIVRIQEVSGGNPFYAIELARAMDGDQRSAEMPLPMTLTELVRARIGSIDESVRDVLLVMACHAAPSVVLVSRATDMNEREVVAHLEEVEAKGIVVIDGHRLRFAHPLLAKGFYTDVAPARRRAMHRRLAEIVDEPELKARHLAMAATHGDEQTLLSLDEAADIARSRGAPVAAAELLDLAIGLGGGTPERRILSAAHHFDAGEPATARGLLQDTISELEPGPRRAEAYTLLALVASLNDSFDEASVLLEQALDDVADELAQRVAILVSLAFALVNSGRMEPAVARIEEAVVCATELGDPHALSQALGMRVVLHFMRGDGLDAGSLARAVELEDRHGHVSSAFSPRVQRALMLAWTGDLEVAHSEMIDIRRRCIDRGEEGELSFIDFHSVLIDIWRGAMADANLIAEDSVERAHQLNGDLPLSVSLTVRAAVAAYAGDEEAVRRDVADAIAASERCGSRRLGEWPVTILGFLELSLGNYEAVLSTVAPLMPMLDAVPDSTEIINATYVPDAAEALVHLGRLDEAEPLIAQLARNGERLDRPWMKAVAARCRAMVSAARGDVETATRCVEQALVEHDRLPMPFERARTLLLAGQLQRRQRQKDQAATTLREALKTFEDLDTRLWAERARAELARADVGARRMSNLSPSEQRVAELAASGMTNRDVAAALFISPKTVESNLARIYRKLGIHSRAELGRQMGQPES